MLFRRNTATNPSPVVLDGDRLHPRIAQAVHLVALDENRTLFKPTLFRKDPRVEEIWFPGVHADVGGGYDNDALSDIPWHYMLTRAEAAGMKLLPPDRATLFPPVELRHLTIRPVLMGLIHYHEADSLSNNALLRDSAPRHVYVANPDNGDADRPLVHWSAKARYLAPWNANHAPYYPLTLQNRPHIVVETSGLATDYPGYAAWGPAPEFGRGYSLV